jgi:hypothetical protein
MIYRYISIFFSQFYIRNGYNGFLIDWESVFCDSVPWVSAIIDLNQHAFLGLKGVTPTFSNFGTLLKTQFFEFRWSSSYVIVHV